MYIRRYVSHTEALNHVLFWHSVAVLDADKVVYHLPNDLAQAQTRRMQMLIRPSLHCQKLPQKQVTNKLPCDERLYRAKSKLP